MVVLAVLLYCLVPSGCPIGHIVYLWTLTVMVSRFFLFFKSNLKYHRFAGLLNIMLNEKVFASCAVLCRDF